MCGADRARSIRWGGWWPWRSARSGVDAAMCTRSANGGRSASRRSAPRWACGESAGRVWRPFTAPFATSTMPPSSGRWGSGLRRKGWRPTDDALAIDGKGLRGIHGEEIPGGRLVAAFAHQARVVLAEAATAGKGHELAGVEAILADLPARLVSGRVVAGDALLASCGRCRPIVRKGDTISSP